ncbi:hypothetical protein bcgnr5388_31060 [Bacillus cereus]
MEVRMYPLLGNSQTVVNGITTKKFVKLYIPFEKIIRDTQNV